MTRRLLDRILRHIPVNWSLEIHNEGIGVRLRYRAFVCNRHFAKEVVIIRGNAPIVDDLPQRMEDARTEMRRAF